jgi:hypothetical protein
MGWVSRLLPESRLRVALYLSPLSAVLVYSFAICFDSGGLPTSGEGWLYGVVVMAAVVAYAACFCGAVLWQWLALRGSPTKWYVCAVVGLVVGGCGAFLATLPNPDLARVMFYAVAALAGVAVAGFFCLISGQA